MAAGKLRHPSIPRRTAFRVAVQHEDRARFAPGVGEVVDHIVKIEIWWNAQCGHSACPFRFSDDRCGPHAATESRPSPSEVDGCAAHATTGIRHAPRACWPW